MIKILLCLSCIIFTLRLLTFNFNTLPPQNLTINTFNRFPNSFYTAQSGDFNLSFSYKGKLEPQHIISYTSYKYDEKYKSYTLKGVKVIHSNPMGFSRLKKNLYYLKKDLLIQLNTILKGKSYQLSAGMLFGEKSALDKDFKENLVKVGLIHIVVVSGFNISLVGLLILNTFKRFGQIAYVFSLMGIIMYSVFVGLEPPVLRALIMGGIVILARVKGEESNQIYLLLITALIMVFFNPLILKSLSFQLSFMATLGILTFTPIFDQLINPESIEGPKILSDLSASLSAQLMVLPILAYNFGQVSIISPVANLLTLWAVPVITVVSGFLLLISLASIKVATMLSFLVTIPSLIIEMVTSNFAELNYASVMVQVDLKKVIVTYFCMFSFYLYYIFYLSRQ